MTPYQTQELHIYARDLHQRYLVSDAVFDKALLRFNDVVEVGLHWTRRGPITSQSFQNAKAGVREAILACVKVWVTDRGPVVEPMYVAGSGPKAMINTWMEDWRS